MWLKNKLKLQIDEVIFQQLKFYIQIIIFFSIIRKKNF